MGYDISEAKHQKLVKNRADGRLCGGATRARGGCSTRATVRELHLFWTTEAEKDAGEPGRESSINL